MAAETVGAATSTTFSASSASSSKVAVELVEASTIRTLIVATVGTAPVGRYCWYSAHLRPGSQVKLLFVSSFQRLIILHEHAV